MFLTVYVFNGLDHGSEPIPGFIFLYFGYIPVTDIPFRRILGLNQQSYQRLKVALSLNLRRQIFIAVCDDLVLRDRLSAQLQAELAKAHSSNPEAIELPQSQSAPRLVSLHLNLTDPNPIVQMAQWLTQAPSPKGGWQSGNMPAFQILGIEKLTRQPAAIQRLFFTHLQSMEYNLPLLESSLILWLTQPWVRALPQSAPEFWRCRTGIFEFIGEPTPLFVTTPERIGVPSSVAASPSQKTDGAEATAGVDKPTANPWEVLARDLDSLHLFETNPEVEKQDTPQKAISGSGLSQGSHSLAPKVSEAKTSEPKTSETKISEAKISEPKSSEPKSSEPKSSEAKIANSAGLKSEAGSAPLQVQKNLPQALHQTAATQNLVAMDAPVKGATSLAATIPASWQSTDLRQLPLVQQIEILHQQQAPSEALAGAYCTLGNFYRDRIEQGETTLEHIAIAIQAYEQGLHYLSEASPLWVDVLNDVGNLYWMLSRLMTSTQEALPYLQRGLQAYQLALTKINPQNQAHTYPMLQNNLGAAYADLARHQDPADSLRRSVEAYLQALRYRSPESDPLRYASTQNNLGTTYWNLAQHQQPEANLKQAIAAYSEALRFYDPATESLNYAMIQNNLGTAYWNLAQYERPRDWLALALAAYRTALKYRTLDTAPVAFAATQNNLGTAYWHMANHAGDPESRLSYLQEAIAAYEATLRAAERSIQRHPSPPLNFDLVATQNNLGLAHYQIATEMQASLTSEQQSHHLSAALKHHVLALQAWAEKPELRQSALNRMIETIRAFYSQLGLAGQNRALSMVPGQLLPEILPKL